MDEPNHYTTLTAASGKRQQSHASTTPDAVLELLDRLAVIGRTINPDDDLQQPDDKQVFTALPGGKAMKSSLQPDVRVRRATATEHRNFNK